MRRRRTTTGITIHTAATKPSLDADARMIRRWHKARGWSDIGYHFVIKRDGTTEDGRRIDLAGAHEPRSNRTDIGVCMVGGLNQETGKPENNYTPEQWDALKALIKDLYDRYGELKIRGHRDWSPDRDGDGKIEPHEWMKACPCFDASDWAWENGFVGALPKPGGSKPAPKEINTPKVRLPVLRNSARGAAVKRLQKYLNNKGEKLVVDGIWGAATHGAVIRFQKANGLKVDGIVGKRTWKALKEK